ncbi:MAG: hypothetical protein K0M50_10750 [Prolixibacteraceae bacterium]|nr:hypothetical protein [Prolixibacteraceae bacterium]
MKQTKTIFSIMVLLLTFTSACTDKVYETFTANAPVYMSYADLRSAVKMSTAREMNNPGKIYFKDQYIFINEKMKGVHVYDVSNPNSPQNKGFIEIPGNVDIAIKDNILYADSYVDLVSIDVSSFSAIKEVGRVEKVFPYTLPSYDTKYPLAKLDEKKGVVTDWEVKSVRQELEQIYYPTYYRYESLTMDNAYLSNGGITGSSGAAGSTYGVGGSMARFGLYKDFLYIVNQSSLLTFKLNSNSQVTLLNTTYVNWIVETIFITDNHLFLGTQSGLIVQSLEVPEKPSQKGTFSHMTACDPVVIKGDLAFVTLKGGTTCRGSLNQLDVVQMSNSYSKFTLLKSYPMYGPQGLGIDDDLLFICDGDAGLKIYNAADPLAIVQLAIFPSIHAYDVIPMNDYLFMIGEEGFMLYDYSKIQDIKQIGIIPVVKKI